jgi:hypothetical protein
MIGGELEIAGVDMGARGGGGTFARSRGVLEELGECSRRR